jgi:hypothetical protein
VDGQPDVAVAVVNEIINLRRGDLLATVDGNVTGTLSGLPTGAHKLYIHGETRLSGHTETLHDFNATVYFVVDNVTPVIQVLSPQQKTYSLPSVSLEFTTNQPLS